MGCEEGLTDLGIVLKGSTDITSKFLNMMSGVGPEKMHSRVFPHGLRGIVSTALRLHVTREN